MTKQEIIKNAKATAYREGYGQIIYTDESDYCFSRLFPLNNMFSVQNVVGYVSAHWRHDGRHVEYKDFNRAAYDRFTPAKRTALDGRVWWCVWDSLKHDFSTLSCFGRYKRKKDCLYAIFTGVLEHGSLM